MEALISLLSDPQTRADVKKGERISKDICKQAIKELNAFRRDKDGDGNRSKEGQPLKSATGSGSSFKTAGAVIKSGAQNIKV